MHITAPPVRDLVLLGGGHSHLQVLKAFGMRPVPGVRLTVVCRERLTPYSGMLPGQVAGAYDWRAMHVDLGRLARYAGARLIEDEVVGLDPDICSIRLCDHPPLHYDRLSINVGAVPDQPVSFGIAVKPIGRFLPQWRLALERYQPGSVFGIVGGGAGGVELALAMRAALPEDARLVLFTATLLPGGSAALRRTAERALAQTGIAIEQGFRVVDAAAGTVFAADGRQARVDQLFWVTRAAAPSWLARAGLATDADGFIEVEADLRSRSHPEIFAAGDCVALLGQPRPKAGVYAVRAGPVLAQNLRQSFLGGRLQRFRAQRQHLAILGTGDGRAIAARGAWALSGRWAWRWKDWIDRRFMARFTDLPEMPGEAVGQLPAALAADLPDAERCGGCGAKLAADPLRRVLARLPDQSHAHVVRGIGDDAAVIEMGAGRMLFTVDGFRSLIDDPYLFGRITAHHSLNDVFAMGGRPEVALAMATVPLMAERMMEEDLYWLLRGAVDVLNAHQVALVGGHSAEGAELSLGLTVAGCEGARVLGKEGLCSGDRLVLTKALGSGVLMAANMRGVARSDQVALALRAMDTSNADALAVLLECGVTAATDVTGFGLLGHLAEMLRASGVGARIETDSVPVFEGALLLAAQGITSSLHLGNARTLLDFSIADRVDTARRALLVDPQTSGGLLAGVPAVMAEQCVAALHGAGYADACIIGTVSDHGWALV